jgi:hypothetical protein
MKTTSVGEEVENIAGLVENSFLVTQKVKYRAGGVAQW